MNAVMTVGDARDERYQREAEEFYQRNKRKILNMQAKIRYWKNKFFDNPTEHNRDGLMRVKKELSDFFGPF